MELQFQMCRVLCVNVTHNQKSDVNGQIKVEHVLLTTSRSAIDVMWMET